MPDPSYFDLFGAQGAQAAPDIARALQGRRAISQFQANTPNPETHAVGMVGLQSADQGDAALQRAGEGAPFVALKQALLTAQNKALGPQADLGGKTTANYEAMTKRMQETAWDAQPDPLGSGDIILRNRHNPTQAYRLNTEEGISPIGQQGAAQASAGVPLRAMGHGTVAGALSGPPQPFHPDRQKLKEQLLLLKMPEKEREQYLSANDIESTGNNALAAISANPGGFGPRGNLAALIPGEGAGARFLQNTISGLQDNHRTKGELEARRLAIDVMAQKAHDFAASRGFANNEMPIWAQLVGDPNSLQSAHVISTKIHGVIKEAKEHRARLRAAFMNQLPPEASNPEDAAAAARLKYGGGR